jgi:hypothetical protein
MQTAATFLNAGWDFVGETENGPNDIWKIVEGVTYPLLSWQKYGGGTGEPNAPYLIYTAEHLNALGAEPDDYDKHFKLMADIDLSLYSYDRAVIAPDTNDIGYGYEETPFNGVFDGNGKFLSNLRITGEDYLGLFGKMEADAEVKGLGLVDVNIVGTGTYIGGLAGWSDGSINRCYSTGDVSGYYGVGGLVGFQRRGNISVCHSQCTVEGSYIIGGLTGETYRWASISCSHSTGTIKGEGHVGGLAGTLFGKITTCRSTSIIEGKEYVGGFVGAAYQENGQQALIANCYCSGAVYGDFGVGGFLGMDVRGIITNCYSTSFVSGNNRTGGFAGWFRGNTGGRGVDPEREDPSCCTTASFWDFEASEFQDSDGGIGLTTTQMQTITTFLDAGWDFLGETENGTDDIWWIDEGRDYPRLWWELEQ